MAALSEATVQATAQNYLKKKYQRKARGGRIFSQIEVRTKKIYGGKRADGLIAFKGWFTGAYVISMEAKSSKTLPAIKPYTDWWLLFRNCLKAGFLIAILTGAIFAFFKMDDPYLQILLPLNVFIAGALFYGLLTRKSSTHKVVKVIKQIGQYPANEQWLAFSRDSISGLSLDKIKSLETLCKIQGIGILVVKPKGKVEIVIKPKKRWKWWNDYLKYYSKEAEIREEIG